MSIIRGDATRVPLPDCSVDAVVTDPPYGLEFMGKEWDRLGPGTFEGYEKAPEVGARERDPNGTSTRFTDKPRWSARNASADAVAQGRRHARAAQQWHELWAREALRVLKPGGHLLAFGGTRTYHRMTCAIEDAGFEIRDCLAWLYGSGFPKSLDVSKALDITAPVTPEAHQWQGWGTALKPAHEPIVLARKPLSGTVAQNVTMWGTGALNIDGSRLDNGQPRTTHADGNHRMSTTDGWRWQPHDYDAPAGRWPPNVTMDEEAARLLDAQSGERAGATPFSRPKHYNGSSYVVGDAELQLGYGDTGGASRFMYVAKASREERNRGLEGMPKRDAPWLHDDGRAQPRPLSDPRMDREQERRPQQNHHPTVKPLALMRWLVRLITPPGGLVLDPFLGSGTTMLAAHHEGFRCVGIEREAEYVDIAKGRNSAPVQAGLAL